MRFSDFDKLGDGDVEAIARLGRTPGWEALQSLRDARYERQQVEWGKEIARGEIPDAVQVAAERGFWDGVRTVLGLPQVADGEYGRRMKEKT